jgi:hypothetical protein
MNLEALMNNFLSDSQNAKKLCTWEDNPFDGHQILQNFFLALSHHYGHMLQVVHPWQVTAHGDRQVITILSNPQNFPSMGSPAMNRWKVTRGERLRKQGSKG